ncbi:MAG: alpha/beta hydrolase [Azospira oryzae]|jgi:predicted alpha/beta hydrolase family esterase|nr:MAG: alpha/beta hydrolase [Azospira oryzae]
MNFKSSVFILPGLGNSGEQHWQSLWEKQFYFKRIQQKEWNTPICEEWIKTIDETVCQYQLDNVILIGHSLACTTIAYWAAKYNRKIKGALLVAPSDTEAPTYPAGTSGFTPVPLQRLPFKTIVVASSADDYVTLERATLFATRWGSRFENIGPAGHINVAAGFGQWDEGIAFLRQLDS